MAKQKFTLTSDLVKVEPEPTEIKSAFEQVQSPPVKESEVVSKEKSKIKKKIETKELINFRLETTLKREFQRWCFEERVNMSDVVTDLIKKKLGKE